VVALGEAEVQVVEEDRPPAGRRKLRAHLLGVFLGTAIWVTTFPAKLTV
jgi:hypothetical protein